MPGGDEAGNASSPKGPKQKNSKRSYTKTKQNPSRGPPGILFTCEQGWERKYALELLQRDWEVAIVEKNSTMEAKKASLEDEIKQLKDGDENAVFEQLDTRCKGVVILLCKACKNLVEPLPRPKGESDQAVEEKPPPTKKPRVDEHTAVEESSKESENSNIEKFENSTTEKIETSPIAATPQKSSIAWDPVAAIQRIINELNQTDSTNNYPSSRFISRMIPCQATFYAGIPELQHTIKSILEGSEQQYPLTKQTFAIRIKRRFCDGIIVRKDVIDAVAGVVLASRPTWKVNLKEPDVVIQLEFCQTLATVAICKAKWASVAYRREKE